MIINFIIRCVLRTGFVFRSVYISVGKNIKKKMENFIQLANNMKA